MQVALLVLAVFACSTSIVFIKESNIDSVLLAALRLATAAVVVTPLYLRDLRKHREALTWRMPLDAALPGALLALHLITWNIGGRMTLSANATLIVNLVPLVMPLLLAKLAYERLNLGELAATGVATIGIVFLFVNDYHVSPAHFRGDLMCLVSMSLLAVYLVLGRKHRQQPTLWLYMTPLFYAAGATAFLCVPFFAQDTTVDWSHEWKWIAALVLVPTLTGHTLFNNAMRYFRGQLVALASLCQFVFAGALAYAFLGEAPDWSFYPAAALAVAGGMVAVVAHHQAKEPASDLPASPQTAAE